MSAATDLQPAHERIVHLLKSGHAQQAEEQARLILRELPQEPNTVFLLAKARHLRGASAEAVELLDGLIARHRDWLSVHQEKALILRAAGDLAGSVASLREVVRLDPTRASAWGLIAGLLTTLGEQAAADEAMRQYLKAGARPEVLVKAAGLVAQAFSRWNHALALSCVAHDNVAGQHRPDLVLQEKRASCARAGLHAPRMT